MSCNRRVFADRLPSLLTPLICLLRRRVCLSRELSDEVMRSRGCITKLKNIFQGDANISYFDNKLHGLSQSWRPNGVLWWEATYVNDRTHGIQREYYEDGTRYYEMQYVNGKQQGLSRGWFHGGDLWWDSSYVDNKEHDSEIS